MANPTTNYGWQMPTPTDLVTDLPADFEVFGQAVDTSLLGLKGGTTGQVLSKTSGTDMAFTWATDASGIPATIVDAKGDIIAATAADAVSRLAVGANATVLTADSTTATGLKWAATEGDYIKIAEIVNTTTSAFTFSSIPSTYRHLTIILDARSSWGGGNAGIGSIRFNGSTASIYDYVSTSQNVGAAGDRNTSLSYIPSFQTVPATAATSMSFPAHIVIPNYKGTTFFKNLFSSTGSMWNTTAANFASYGITGRWRSTDAITSITLLDASGGDFIAGSVATLYGVK